MFNEELRSKRFRTKNDFKFAFEVITERLLPFLKSQKTGHLKLGTSGSVYGENTRQIEGFLRVLWGLGPYIADGNKSPLLNLYKTGIVEGTDTSSESYWGKTNDYDQLFVEMASVSTALLLSKENFWDVLTKEQQKNLHDWLIQINEHTIPKTNWLFFRVLVNIAMKKCGEKWSEEIVEKDLKEIDSFYLSNGWYYDGYKTQIDYYIPFAMHYYGLLYAVFMEEEDPKRSKLFKERAAKFAQDYQYWFDEKGAALPFGRSLNYRFAQAAFWSALVFANVEAFSWSKIKGIICRNFTYWMKQDIFSSDGILTVGYCYQNLNMAEGYNAPGSPYWSMKLFLLLAIPDDHPFWSASIEKLELEDKIVYQPNARMIITHSDNGREAQAFTAGQYAKEHAHADAKYSKFVYSTTFGFSVPKGNLNLKQGAFDSCLALSEGDGHYRSRQECEDYAIKSNQIWSRWYPWKDVKIETTIIPLIGWHIRIHKIINNRYLETAEGGFSIPVSDSDTFIKDETKLIYKSRCGISAIFSFSDEQETELVRPEPNTNLLYSRTALPTLITKLNPGQHVLISLIYGGQDEIMVIPKVNVFEGKIIVNYKKQEQVIEY